MLTWALSLLIWQCWTQPIHSLTLEKLDNSTDDAETTTAKVIKINNGILFENGVLKEYNPINKTENLSEEEDYDDDEPDPIVFNEDVIKIAEMLSDDSVQFTRLPDTLKVDEYHNYEMLQEISNSLTGSYPNLVMKYSLGNSVQNRELVAWKLRSNVTSERPVGVAMVKIIGNMHGDESVGREMIIALAQYLVNNYESDERVTRILDNTEVHLVPSMNPDGFEVVTRGNYNQVDLNRAFPGKMKNYGMNEI